MTIATHANFNGGTGAWQRIFDFGSGTTNYMFLMPASGARPAPMRFAIRTATVAEQVVDAPAAHAVGWHHVAVVIDSTTMTMTAVPRRRGGGHGRHDPAAQGSGQHDPELAGQVAVAGDAYFSGMLDEFRIYNRVLSAAEVRYLAGDR